jgi:hypothetical protein
MNTERKRNNLKTSNSASENRGKPKIINARKYLRIWDDKIKLVADKEFAYKNGLME